MTLETTRIEASGISPDVDGRVPVAQPVVNRIGGGWAVTYAEPAVELRSPLTVPGGGCPAAQPEIARHLLRQRKPSCASGWSR